jgi:hypothetical protein
VRRQFIQQSRPFSISARRPIDIRLTELQAVLYELKPLATRISSKSTLQKEPFTGIRQLITNVGSMLGAVLRGGFAEYPQWLHDVEPLLC